MSTFYGSVERRSTNQVKAVKRPRGPQLLTFLFTFFQPATFMLLGTLQEQPIKAATRKHPPNFSSPSPPPAPSPPGPMDSIFIEFLVKACSCQHHAKPQPFRNSTSNPGYIYHKARRRQSYTGVRQVRHIHHANVPSHPPSIRTPLSRDEYMSMLDYYREPYSTHATVVESDHPSPDPLVFNPMVRELRTPLLEKPSLGISEPAIPEHDDSSRRDVSVVEIVLKTLIRSDCTHSEAFDAYSTLPFPGVSLLSEDMRRLLFRRLSTIEKKNKDSMLRYLSVVDDMKACDLPLTQGAWNSAIAFCGQCFAHIQATDVESALRTWREMEREAQVKSGNVTFNILFSMAAKAGKFVLAEMILKEMQARNLRINRYALVDYIYYNGLKGDGDGVRRAYRVFVESGQIVDTVVMNCVIASLLRAGEPAAAEHVYERMKRMLSKYTGKSLPQLNWQQVRDLGRVLDKAARQLKADPAEFQRLQDEQLLVPNLHTYAIFVEHHASQTGELCRVAAFLTEMQHLGIPMHGRIFLKIFKGFAYHGGIRYTSWTKARLESVWSSLLDVLDQGLDDVRIKKWMVIWTVRAFERCAGRDRTLEIWEELRQRWKPGGGEMEVVMGVLRDILKVGDGNT